jgi:hypothetical protein
MVVRGMEAVIVVGLLLVELLPPIWDIWEPPVELAVAWVEV